MLEVGRAILRILAARLLALNLTMMSLKSCHACNFAVCDMKCGDWGCLKGTNHLCCHKQCIGGCFSYHNSPYHCYACMHFRQMSNGECVERCQETDPFEVHLLYYLIWKYIVDWYCPGL